MRRLYERGRCHRFKSIGTRELSMDRNVIVMR